MTRVWEPKSEAVHRRDPPNWLPRGYRRYHGAGRGAAGMDRAAGSSPVLLAPLAWRVCVHVYAAFATKPSPTPIFSHFDTPVGGSQASESLARSGAGRYGPVRDSLQGAGGGRQPAGVQHHQGQPTDAGRGWPLPAGPSEGFRCGADQATQQGAVQCRHNAADGQGGGGEHGRPQGGAAPPPQCTTAPAHPHLGHSPKLAVPARASLHSWASSS